MDETPIGPGSSAWSRRALLRAAALSPLAAWVPGVAGAAPGRPVRRLLLVELNGGNDALNMVVPYADPAYYSFRPAIAVARDEVLQLDGRVGLHPRLQPLLPAFQAREMAVLLGLGYPDTNRSHFTSIEIWDSASERPTGEGWVSRVGSPAKLGGGFAADAVVIGRNPAPVAGGEFDPVVLTTTQSFVANARDIQAVERQSGNAALRHILRVQQEIEGAVTGLSVKRAAAPGEFPKDPFGRDLAEAAKLLIGAPAAPVVKVALSGFDTHVQQKGKHDRLMIQLGQGLGAFRASMQAAGVWAHTLVLTYSEFGRRVKQNGSNGTDHGAAAAHFVLGGSIQGGLYGSPPDLKALDNGDLKVTTDFRCVYNAVLADWWGQPGAQIEASRYRKLNFV